MIPEQIQVGDEIIRFRPPTQTNSGTVPVHQSYGKIAGLLPPDWADDAIIYELYVRNFSERGDFNGVIDQLPRLQEMGINTLWLMPIHPIGQKGRKGNLGSPYSVQDYFAVNPEYGDEQDFRRLVEQAHAAGIRLLLDLVINHSANDHVLMTLKPQWWRWNQQGRPTRRISWWQDVADFNYHQRELWDYLVTVMKFWIEKFDINGFRCDVAGMVPQPFWRFAVPQLQKVKSDVFLLAEWEDPVLHLDSFHATYNWTLYYKMLDVVKRRCPAEELLDVFLFKSLTFPQHALRLNFIENHDEKRSAKIFGISQCRPFAGLIFALPGIPLLYNGQESGSREYLSLFEHQPIAWHKNEPEMSKLYRDLVHLRRRLPLLRRGNVEKIKVADQQQVVAFLRRLGQQIVLCVFNFSDDYKKVALPMKSQLSDFHSPGKWQTLTNTESYQITAEKILLELPPWQGEIIWRE